MAFSRTRVTFLSTVLATAAVVVAGVALRVTGERSLARGAGDSAIAADVTPGISLGDAAARRFDANDLDVGDVFPALKVFDSAGHVFDTSSLKGQYTVLVSGCLT